MFIGSSTEGKTVAQKIRSQLKDDAEITIWHEGAFGLGLAVMESLENVVSRVDFAVLVLTPDDLTRSRGRLSRSPRDNVLFECGLFVGRLGRRRVFMVFDSEAQVKIPTDLAGITLALYRGKRNDGNLLAAVGEACDPIRDAIHELGPLARTELEAADAPVLGLHHVSLPVKHLKASVKFYRELLGMSPLPQAPRSEPNAPDKRPYFGFPGAWFQFASGQGLHLVEHVSPDDEPVTFRVSGDLNYKDVHFAIRVRDHAATCAMLEGRGTRIVPGPREFQCYILDPDDHIIEITSLNGPGPERKQK